MKNKNQKGFSILELLVVIGVVSIVAAIGMPAISNFGEMGFHIHLVKDGSLDDLKEKLLYIATNFEEEKRLALQNIEKAKEVFSTKREASQYIELLR